MCGRYTGNDDDDMEMSAIYQRTLGRYPNAVLKHGEILPTDTAPILFGERMLAVPAKWGFPSYKGSGVLINARSETAAEKEMFRESMLCRRCVVPTTGYIEWDSEKTKYRFNRYGSKILYLGGFCKRFGDGAKFIILTTSPNESVKSIHSRMPVILNNDAETLKKWNEDTEWAMNYLKTEMPELIHTAI